MKKILLFLIVTAFSINNVVQAQYLFNKTYTSASATSNEVSDFIINKDGEYIILGRKDEGANNYISVLKTSANGDPVWEKVFRYGNLDFPVAIRETSNDNGYIICGNGLNSNFLIKIDENGIYQWSNHIPNGTLKSIKITAPDNGFIITGYTSLETLGGIDKSNAYIVKTSSTGVIEWRKVLKGDYDDYAVSADQDSDGNYIVAGETQSYNMGGIFIMKLDPAGNKLWSNTYESSVDNEVADPIVLTTNDGRYIISGKSRPTGYEDQIFLMELNKNTGGIIWKKRMEYDYDKWFYATSLEETSNGFVIGGTTQRTDALFADIFLLTTDRQGEPIITIKYENTGGNLLGTAYQTADGGYVMGGSLDGTSNIIKTNPVGHSGCYDVPFLVYPENPNIVAMSVEMAETGLTPPTQNPPVPAADFRTPITTTNCFAYCAGVVMPTIATSCINEATTLTADAGYSYVWSTGETTQSIVPASVGTYTVTVYDAAGCWGSATYTVTETYCCVVPNATTTLTNATISTATTYYTTGGIIFIDGDLYVNANVTFTGQQVKISPDAKIIVQNGKRLIIDNSTLEAACSSMWDGIYIGGGAVVEVKSNSLIRDAKNAIVSTGGGRYIIENSTFDLNYKALVVSNWFGTHPGTIKGTTIKNTAGSTLIKPYAGQRALLGMELLNAGTVNIGDASSAANKNTFENMSYGIVSKASNVNAKNNLFSTINGNGGLLAGITVTGKGFGIYFEKLVTGNPIYTLNVGGHAVNEPNRFIDCSYGTFVYNEVNANIIKNTFTNNSSYAVYVYNAKKANIININYNTISSSGVGIGAYYNNTSVVNILSNSISGAAYYGYTGIKVAETSPSTNARYNINSNNISSVFKGIEGTNLYKLIAENNRITLFTAAGSTSPSYGILLSNSNYGSIKANTVNASDRNNNWTHGIRIESGQANTVSCNTMNKTGSGLWFSNAQPGTAIIKNTMNTNYWGLVINDGYIGGQIRHLDKGTVTAADDEQVPNDNKWLGTYSTTYPHTLAQNNAIGSLSKLYVRNNGNIYIPIFNNTLSNSSPITTEGIDGNSNDWICPTGRIVSPVGPVLISEKLRYMAHPIAKDELTFPENTEEMRWWSKYNLQRQLKETPNWKDNDVVLTDFETITTAANMGRLEDINKRLSDPGKWSTAELEQAKTENEAIASANDIETNYKKVNGVEAERLLSTEQKLNTLHLATLREVAQKCPYTDGPAVYHARAILAGVDAAEYFSSCETDNLSIARMAGRDASNGDAVEEMPSFSDNQRVRLYPNPNNGTMNFNFNLSESEKGVLQIFDITGKMVKEFKVNGNNLMVSEDTFKNGIYFYQLVVDGKIENRDKIVIIK